MTLATSAKIFPLNDVLAGTAVDTWLNGLSITTIKGITQTVMGSSQVLMTVVYE